MACPNKCENCDNYGRLTLVNPFCELGDDNYHHNDWVQLCDECYESWTGDVAQCQDSCTLPLDHRGFCN